MKNGHHPEEIEASRRRLGIAADWTWEPCANLCGDIVWLPPDVLATARETGAPIAVACSAKCAKEFSDRLQAESP